jgi:hypothetical protein
MTWYFLVGVSIVAWFSAAAACALFIGQAAPAWPPLD